MADLMNRRFAELSGDEMQELNNILENRDSHNTKQVIVSATNILKEYCAAKGQNFDDLLKMKVPELVDFLQRLYAELRKRDGEVYKRTSLFSIRFGLHRMFLEQSNIDIINDQRFKPANEIFKTVLIAMKKEGKGEVKHTEIICNADLKKLYSSNVLSTDNPEGLQNKVFFDILYYSCRRGRSYLRNMVKSDLELKTDSEGRIFFLNKYMGGNLKSKTSSPTDSETEVDDPNEKSRIYEVPGDPCCPVQAIQKYLAKLHPDCLFLWQRPKKHIRHADRVWYDSSPLGHNTLGRMMRTMSEKAELSQIYSNQSIRETCLTALNWKEIGARCAIMVTPSMNAPRKKMAVLGKTYVNPDHSSQLLVQMSELWRGNKYCDAAIALNNTKFKILWDVLGCTVVQLCVCIYHEEYNAILLKVHKLVLLAACPNIQSLLSYTENNLLELKLPDHHEESAVRAILDYLYDGALKLTEDNVQGIKALAEYLQLQTVNQYSQEFRSSLDNKPEESSDEIRKENEVRCRVNLHGQALSSASSHQLTSKSSIETEPQTQLTYFRPQGDVFTHSLPSSGPCCMVDRPVLQQSENPVQSSELLVSVKVETLDDTADDNCYDTLQQQQQQYENMPWSDGVLKRDQFSSSERDSVDSSHLQQGNTRSCSMWNTSINYDPIQQGETSVYGLPSLVTRQTLKRKFDISDDYIRKNSVPYTRVGCKVTTSSASNAQNFLMMGIAPSTMPEPVIPIRNSLSLKGCSVPSSHESRGCSALLTKQPTIR